MPFERHRLLGGVEVLDQQLPTGARLLVVPASRPGPVAVALWVCSGTAVEREQEHGFAHLLEHMLFKPALRDGKTVDLARAIESLGGDVNAFTSHDETVVHATVPSTGAQEAIVAIADAVLRPTFDATELSREIEVVVEEIGQYEDDPGGSASQRALELAFAGHPYARPVLGERAEVRSATPAKLRAFHRRAYGAERTSLIVVGATRPEEVRDTAMRALAGQPRRRRAAAPEVIDRRAPAVEVKLQPINESHVHLAWSGPTLPDARACALEAASVILGYSEASRLAVNVRRKAGLVTDINASLYASRDGSGFVVGLGGPPNQTEAAIQAVFAEIDRLRQAPVDAEELRRAKAVMRSEAIYRRDSVGGLAQAIGYQLSFSGNLELERTYFDQIEALDAEAIRSACAEVLQPKRVGLSAVLAKPGRGGARSEANFRAAVKACIEVADKRPKLAWRKRGRDPIACLDVGKGLRIRALVDPTVPMVSAWMVWPGGLRGETAATAGSSALTGSLLTRGNASIGGDALASEIDGRAAVLEGFSGRNSVGLHFECLRQDQEAVFRRALECAIAPSFEAPEFERERAIALDELEADEDDVAGRCFEAAFASLYRGHAFRLRRGGTRSSLRRATAAGLRRRWQQRHPLGAAVLGLCGDVDLDAIARWVEDASQLPTVTTGVAPQPSRAARYPKRPVELEIEGAREQSHVVAVYGGLVMGDPRSAAMDVLMTVLGGQAGRLFDALRERDGLVYHVSASSLEGVDAGHVAFYAATSHDKRSRAHDALRSEVQRLRVEGISRRELTLAKRWLVGQHEIENQRRSRLASLLAFDEVYGLGAAHHRGQVSRIRAVKQGDVESLTAELLDPQRCVTVLSGP